MYTKYNKLPSISVVIPTYNSARTIGKCLKSLTNQDYPKNLIELIIVDGGSKDATLKLAKKSGAKIINVSSILQNAEYNKGVGVNIAKNEILLMLDHDNILPHKKWLQKIVQPFLENKEIVGVEPLRFYYDRKMSIMDKYFALLGGTDPVAFYLGKNSHLSYMYNDYNLLGQSTDKGDYYAVKFFANNIPTIGGNGAAIRRKFILDFSKSDPINFFHIDVHVDLIKRGYNNYAVIKDSIVHLTHSKFLSFLRRRAYFVEKYYYENNKRRRYSVFDPKRDKLKLAYYVIISLTLVKPLLDATRGFMKIRDIAWYMHPVMCLCMLFAYGLPVLRNQISKTTLHI